MYNDLLAIALISVIFGLQILVALQSTGGPEALAMIASDGMQSP